MQLIKRWQLNLNTYTEADIIWLRKYSHTIDFKRNDVEVNAYGRSFVCAGTTITYIQTTTQEQEDMLYLKYGKSLFLHAQCWVNDNEVYWDEHGTFTSFRHGVN